MPCRVAAALGVASAALASLSRAEVTAEVGACAFEVEPTFPGYFWDPSCESGMEGCLADGVNMECRFCGGGNYSVPCPPSSCHFPNDPFMPYYWDPACESGMLGCWADGIHVQCRFCGEHPYTGVACPEGLSAAPNGAECTFTENEPTTPYYWDAGCEMGVHGCNADGIHVQCRFCGKGVFADIPCPASEVCSFAVQPATPYYWDPECTLGKLGCMADGVHPECRFCEKMPFEDISCPGPIQPPKDQCTFPVHSKPTTGTYWEEACVSGMLGCWADGMHAECRFCGSGAFAEIPCPNATAAAPSAAPAAAAAATAEEQTYDAAAASHAFMLASSMAPVAQDVAPSAAAEQGADAISLSGAALAAPSVQAIAATLGCMVAGAAGMM